MNRKGGATYRYPGVQPFSKAQKALFFGRDDDRERLLDLILLEKLMVLFGKSGYGKSSLLNAGILPGLDDESARKQRQYIPVVVRFHSWTAGKDGLFQKFLFCLNASMGQVGIQPLEKWSALPDTLWSRLKFTPLPENATVVLIFDQFEEFFTYPEQQQLDFKWQLAELLYADVPTYLKQNEDHHSSSERNFLAEKMDVKAVMSIRADRLSELDRLKDKLPAILHKRYELRALTPEQAREALEKPAKLKGDFLSPAFSWQATTTTIILNELSSDRLGRSAGVEAFQMQILAQNIENRVIQGEIIDRNGDALPDVSPEDLPADFSRIYAEYYYYKIANLPQRLQATARRLIEDGLVFSGDQGEARRLSMDGDLLRQQYGATSELLEALENTFLLRREINALGGWNYELSHDTLIKPVVEARDIRRAEEERREAEHRAQEAEAKAAEEQRRADEAERLQKIAERQRNRAKRMMYLAIVMALLALAGLIGAGYLYQQAERQKLTIQKEKDKADQNLKAFLEAQGRKDILEIEQLESRGDVLVETQNYGIALELYQKALVQADTSPAKNNLNSLVLRLKDKIEQQKNRLR